MALLGSLFLLQPDSFLSASALNLAMALSGPFLELDVVSSAPSQLHYFVLYYIICTASFACLCGIFFIYCAHAKYSFFFQFPLQLGAKLLVIYELTISILGGLRRHRVPLATHQHTKTSVIKGIIGSNNSNKSSSSSNKVGRLELVWSYTYVQLTQDRGMEGATRYNHRRTLHLWHVM